VECVGAQKKFRDTAANHCQFQTIERITVSTRMIHSVFRAPPSAAVPFANKTVAQQNKIFENSLFAVVYRMASLMLYCI